MTPPVTGITKGGSYIAFGEYGIKATTNWYVTDRQIESARKVIVRSVKKVGKLWIRIFPDVPFTKHGLEQPMGRGKWEIDHYAARVKKWRVLFEVAGAMQADAIKYLTQAIHKLPIQARLIKKWEIR